MSVYLNTFVGALALAVEQGRLGEQTLPVLAELDGTLRAAGVADPDFSALIDLYGQTPEAQAQQEARILLASRIRQRIELFGEALSRRQRRDMEGERFEPPARLPEPGAKILPFRREPRVGIEANGTATAAISSQDAIHQILKLLEACELQRVREFPYHSWSPLQKVLSFNLSNQVVISIRFAQGRLLYLTIEFDKEAVLSDISRSRFRDLLSGISTPAGSILFRSPLLTEYSIQSIGYGTLSKGEGIYFALIFCEKESVDLLPLLKEILTALQRVFLFSAQ